MMVSIYHDDVTIKILYRLDVLLHQPGSHLLLGWLKLNLILLLGQLRLA